MSIRATLMVMSVGMAYMFLAVAMVGDGSTTPRHWPQRIWGWRW